MPRGRHAATDERQDQHRAGRPDDEPEGHSEQPASPHVVRSAPEQSSNRPPRQLPSPPSPHRSYPPGTSPGCVPRPPATRKPGAGQWLDPSPASRRCAREQRPLRRPRIVAMCSKKGGHQPSSSFSAGHCRYSGLVAMHVDQMLVGQRRPAAGSRLRSNRPDRVDLSGRPRQRDVPVDLVGQAVPGEADQRHAGLPDQLDIVPLPPEPARRIRRVDAVGLGVHHRAPVALPILAGDHVPAEQLAQRARAGRRCRSASRSTRNSRRRASTASGTSAAEEPAVLVLAGRARAGRPASARSTACA